jgi:mono/diheme cytochrome c family protein
MRRGLAILVLSIAAIGMFAGGLAWLLNDPRPPAGASRGERLYYAHCVECHGRDGRGSWRAALFLLRPGDLTAAHRTSAQFDSYAFEVIKNGGSSLGRPGMPSFGYHMSDEDIRAVVAYLRTLPTR